MNVLGRPEVFQGETIFHSLWMVLAWKSPVDVCPHSVWTPVKPITFPAGQKDPNYSIFNFSLISEYLGCLRRWAKLTGR